MYEGGALRKQVVNRDGKPCRPDGTVLEQPKFKVMVGTEAAPAQDAIGPVEYRHLPAVIRGRYLSSEVRSAERLSVDQIRVIAHVDYGDEVTAVFERRPGRVDGWTRTELWECVSRNVDVNRGR